MNRKLCFLCLSLWLTAASAAAAPVVVTPDHWDFGTIPSSKTIKKEVRILNRSGHRRTVQLLATCDCLTPSEGHWEIGPGKTVTVQLTYDPHDDNGTVQKSFVVVEDLGKPANFLFHVEGVVQAKVPQTKRPARTATVRPAQLPGDHVVDAYFTAGCRTCERLLDQTLPERAKKLGIRLRIIRHNLLDSQEMASLLSRLSSQGVPLRALPVLWSGHEILQGEGKIGRNLNSLLESPSSAHEKQSVATGHTRAPELLLLPVLLAGLVDGINPCAFTTLIFLLSYLAVAGKSRRQILVIGIFYTAAVFVTYTLIGFGFFHTIRAAAVFPWVSTILRYGFSVMLVVLAALSLRDAYVAKKGRTKEIAVRLPRYFQDRIRAAIRTRVRSSLLIATAFTLGFLVGVFELACTGEVYFPLISYYLTIHRDLSLAGFLAVYNLAFITPLVVVFFLTYQGMRSDVLAAWFRRHLPKAKLAMSILFACMAVLLLFT